MRRISDEEVCVSEKAIGPYCRKASPNLRVHLRFTSREIQNYLANIPQHLIVGAINLL
jgi:hypothetical protein